MTIHSILHRKFLILRFWFGKRTKLIQPYATVWVEEFQQLKQVFDETLQGLDYRIEHVGSTAVPNLDAKAIIDIDIIYSNATVFDRIKNKLESIGYQHKGDHGIASRDVFKRKGDAAHVVLDRIRHHLYVCLDNSPALERHLLFRDYLRKHAWARLAYQEMKYQLAKKTYQNKHWYAAEKALTINVFIDEIIEKEKSERMLS